MEKETTGQKYNGRICYAERPQKARLVKAAVTVAILNISSMPKGGDDTTASSLLHTPIDE